ncbi:Glycosyl hydrolase family protein with chitinase insertion domain-containing protein [Perilla frutescens var. hirtella]|uniref:Glycosyl hydrolase family protein with chitinase insertion domain-containing protein n=1 Tax=Perilla frutescens var. hirtella TaxID=608512 RepID=A0AAD4J5A7_PERFH|nr:Glycosyl hydrolase family protein with chitinase insertion domain-containing protein [Perilla frutescens var. frutescens]KAH6827476.1 Glycosyl hydrolase family protein with chitinase insertion domain-containing protein [Perilla frutescens var. hirtella]
MASSTKLLIFSALSLLQLLQFSAAQAAVNGGYWFPESGLAASNINSSLFTHLFCAFADLDPSTYQVTVSSSHTAAFSQFTATVQSKNPSVKTILSIGGGSSNATTFSSMASQPSSRQSFINSSIKLARSYGFSGLDMDWEYPQSTTDMTNLGTLLSEWRQAIAADAQSLRKAALLLSGAFYFSPYLDDYMTYPTQSINANMDWVNVMAYDFYDPSWYGFTNSHSMLYDPSDDVSGSYGIGDWIEAGVSANKLALGLPFYGYAWRLANANNHGVLAPATGPAGPDNGAMDYNQIKSFISQNKATVVYNSTIVTNYCYSGTTWIGYDDTQSISKKVSYAKQTGLLGYFVWQVGGDSNWILSKQAKQSWGA